MLAPSGLCGHLLMWSDGHCVEFSPLCSQRDRPARTLPESGVWGRKPHPCTFHESLVNDICKG